MSSYIEEKRRDDERIEKILALVNDLHIKLELVSQTINNEIRKTCEIHETALFDPENGLCKIVPIVNERLKTLTKLLWAMGGAVVYMILNAMGSSVFKIIFK